MTARDLMTANPTTVTARATLAEAWDLMREFKVRHLPVVQNGVMVGILSDRDLAMLDVSRLYTEEGADAVRRSLARTVDDVMAVDVLHVEPETELSEVVAMLIDSKVGALPVVRPGTREVVGIVSYVDVLREVHELVQDR